MKIAIYYDTFFVMGGAERVTLQMAHLLNADIITSGFDKKIAKWLSLKNTVIDLGNSSSKFSKVIGTLFEAPLRFFLNRKRFDTYDIHIFIGFSSIYASVKGRKNIWYCFTPNRMLYDLKEAKLHYPTLLGRMIFYIYINLFAIFDKKTVRNNFQTIISQTKTVQKRVKKYYSIDTGIIYPLVDIDSFYFKKIGDYFLTVSRLTPEKRITLIAEVFTRLPTKKLIIVGDGSERGKIEQIIKNHSNITYIPSCSEEELKELYANCLATIYIPVNEDYGLVPLESMASGKLCIGANEGGLQETILHGKTGYLISPTEKDIISTVNNITEKTALAMKDACLAQAKKFSASTCMEQWRKVIQNV